MFETLRADKYSINIYKTEDNLYHMEFTEYFDKDSPEHKEAFQRSMPYFENVAKALSIVGNCMIDIDKENLIFRLNIDTQFERIADTIVGEFLHHGSLGKATISQLLNMASFAIINPRKC